jgi:hypothetical protein
MGQLIVYACRLSSENRRDKERKRLHVVDGDKARYEAILNRSAVNIQTRGEAFRSSGWSGYDPRLHNLLPSRYGPNAKDIAPDKCWPD